MSTTRSVRVPVRAATAADVPAMGEIARRAFLVSWATFFAWPAVQHWVARDIGAADAAARWGACLVAEADDGEVVGWAEADAASGAVRNLWVHPDFQRNGVGGALLLNAEAKLMEAGTALPHALVAADDCAAFSFLHKLGWLASETAGPLAVEVAPGLAMDHVRFESPGK
eukprot:Unigene12946_Nuclearia_a/m.39271 Unigene12946_Nuclearia_a/g.39271  ORF Unigene12946_Nuclearia_a/g.39271 Unigene12946_Nuclearia_a/m.39271 type:complete len:170 (+) Unigene12946_Nuclearia_a:1-510(+)